MSKDELAAYALEKHQVKLDLRKTLETLQAEVLALDNPEDSPLTDLDEDVVHSGTQYILNRDNGKVFEATEQLKDYLTNWVRCDKDGNLI